MRDAVLKELTENGKLRVKNNRVQGVEGSRGQVEE
jgi:hypothetical protein